MTDKPFEIDDMDSGRDGEPMQVAKRAARPRPKAGQAVIKAAFEAALSSTQVERLHRAKTTAVVIEVPAASWLSPMEDWLDETFGNRWHIIKRGDPSRPRTADGAAEVAKHLSTGGCVFGMATDVASLPANLVAAADLTIRIAAPGPAVLRQAIARFTGRPLSAVPPTIVAGLDLPHIVAAMRPHSGPRKIVRRLERAATRSISLVGEDVTGAPVLATAVEYGPARDFGLALARDIVDFGNLKLSWRDAMKGGLLFGDPGTGKSQLAASVAAAAGVPLLRFSVASFFDKHSHLGTVMAALRETMMLAGAAAVGKGCVAMYEEVEFLPRRDRLDPRNRDWWTPILDLMLLMTDAGLARDGTDGGAGRPVGVFLLAATNHLDMVEPALLRPNRFERAIEVTRPDVAGVANILRFHLAGALAGDDISAIARSIEGSTAAECMAVVRAARRAARLADRPVRLADLAAAAHGDEDPPAQLLWRVAVHEAAHAVATVVAGGGKLVHVTLQGRGHGGYTRTEGDQDDLPTRESIERRAVCGLVAGAAEAAIVGTLSTGWSGADNSDLGMVSALIAHLHATSGLTGNLFIRAEPGDAALAAVRADPEMRDAVEAHLRRLHGRAVALVARHRDRIVAVAEALVQRRHLDAAEVVAIVSAIPENSDQGLVVGDGR